TPNLDVNTTIIDTRTGEAVRSYPSAAMPLVYLADDVALTIDRDPAAGPDPPLPELSLGATGLDRPHLVVARALATGAGRWRLPLPAGVGWSVPGVRYGTEGIVALPRGQNWMITSTHAGRVDVWDLRTGLLMASREVGEFGIDSYVTALESSVMSRIDADGRV